MYETPPPSVIQGNHGATSGGWYISNRHLPVPGLQGGDEVWGAYFVASFYLFELVRSVLPFTDGLFCDIEEICSWST